MINKLIYKLVKAKYKNLNTCSKHKIITTEYNVTKQQYTIIQLQKIII